jgi:hypothetical protein
LPERVRELVGARLQTLSELGRTLAGVAAVIGCEFDFELLEHASGLRQDEAAAGVEELVRRRVLRAMGDQFALVHDRVREVIYAGLLPFRRKLLHRQVAAALESLHAENLSPHVATLGQHYHDGEVWSKAFAYLRKAGFLAVDHSANRRAATMYERALRAFDQLPTKQKKDKKTIEEAVDVCLELRIPLAILGENDRLDTVLAKAEGLDPPAAGERNPTVNFRGRPRTNDTHASTTDPEARLYKKAAGHEAKLAYLGHALMEHRHGLAVQTCVTHATGTAERTAALEMLETLPGRPRKTVAADKAYDTQAFVAAVRALGITPHVTQNTAGRASAIDGRTTAPPGYTLSLRTRKRIEEIFGWLKTVAGLRKLRHRGVGRVWWMFTFAVAGYNLVRIRNLERQAAAV